MKGNIYQTVCPGCGLGCGIYIRESEEGQLSIEHMKSSPVNQGKLCRFAMKLPEYYSQVSCRVDGCKVPVKEAVRAAALRLKDIDSIAMLSAGNTGNEEQVAFSMIASTLGTVTETGTMICSGSVPFISLDEVEVAKRIALFVDPYIQYPLIVRRLLAARRNGAAILSVGTKALHLADRTLNLKPAQYHELELDEDSLIIADIHPYSDPVQTDQLLDLAGNTGAKILFMKPFVNSEGAIRSNGSRTRDLAQLMEDIETGKIKTLVTLDSDPVEMMPDGERAVRILEKLDDLIVISSRASPVTELADVVIASEPVFRKAATFLNVEGRLQKNSGDGTGGIDAMSRLNVELGGNSFDFKLLNSQVIENMTNPTHSMGNSCAGSLMESESIQSSLPEGICELKYIFNPFMWSDVDNDDDFIFLGRTLARKLGLRKGGKVRISSEKGSMKMRYRIEDLPENQVLISRKLPIAAGAVTRLSLEGC